MADPELVGRTLQVLQPLLLHPEPLVWIHAARALGRLTGKLEQMEGTLLDWVLGDSAVLRQRAMTALASLPEERLKFLGGQLIALLDSPTEAVWALGAAAANFAAYAACFSLRAAFRVCHDLCSVFGFAFSRFFESRVAGVVVEAI